MSEQVNRKRPHHGGPMGGPPGAPGEKAKDFKGTMKTILISLKPYRFSLILILSNPMLIPPDQPITLTMTAFCAWRRFSASSKISFACASNTFSVISSSR